MPYLRLYPPGSSRQKIESAIDVVVVPTGISPTRWILPSPDAWEGLSFVPNLNFAPQRFSQI
jgi:hypothetical protein